ncbi:MAG: cytochrome c biogenesis protein CcdA [Candidatus Omnitrophota bacterium]
MEITGRFIDYIIAFWGGVLVSFTPCVYPLIPITASYIGGIDTKGSKLMGFLLSVIYVFGIAMTYCILGILAALTGQVFGRIQNSPIVSLIVGCILVFFGLVLLDIIPLSSFGANIRQKIKPTNLWTVLLFGMASGLAVSPCATPVLGTLLLHIASKQNPIYAVSLLFVFSYGMGASLILVGTFSGIVVHLPKPGPGLIRIKQFCGAILLAVSGYFFFKALSLFVAI